LAQNATNNKEVEENTYLEFSENNIRIKSLIINKWQYMWTNSQHGHFYRKIDPTVSWQIKYEHKNRNRLRLGKCCVNEYLATMKVVESDKCPECSTAVETVEHFLLQCPTRSSAIAYKPCVLDCKVVEVWQDFLSEYVDKKFT